MKKIHGWYAAAFFALLAVEVCIALFVHDAFVRPYVGDVLVVVLLYCFWRIFLPPYRWLPAAVFAVAVAVEVSQYFHLVEVLGLDGNRFFLTILGNAFSWGDMGCYAVGCALAALWQWGEGRVTVKKRQQK